MPINYDNLTFNYWIPERITTDAITVDNHTPTTVTASDCTGVLRNAIKYPTYEYNYNKMITEADLDKYFRRIYKIINEHTVLDITEDDFMKLLEEE